MSTSIEQRVVEMRFDNKQFERGIAQSMTSLDQFNEKLNFKGAGKGLQEISKAAEQVSLSPIVDQTNLVGEKFNAMTVIAITALQRLTNAAITAGSNMVKSLSVDQITGGWNKYVEKTASVQTIMNSTGKSVDEVNGYLQKLMWFSDETSYSFTDMTAALGQMTATGGDIEKIIPLLYGVANATAYAGKSSAEFSRVIYNLNQSYGQGYLSLMDWRSVQNAGVASKELTEQLIRAGEELGRIQKGTVTVGNFTDKLKDKWADTEVMELAFGRFGEMSLKAYEMVESEMVNTASEAYDLLSKTYDGFGLTAAKAAQEAKSFQEAIDATKDAVSSGWMATFEIIFGNYVEAKELWTDLANEMWRVFASGADARNEMLQYWKDIGGRAQAIEAVTEAYKALSRVLGAVKDAIGDILFPGTAQEKGFWLYNATLAVRDFARSLSLSDEAITTLRISFKLLLLPVQAFIQVVRVAVAAMGALIQIAVLLVDKILSLPFHLDRVEKALRSLFGDDRYNRIAESLSTITGKLGDGFAVLSEKASELLGSFEGIKGAKLSEAFKKFLEAIEPLGDWILDRVVDGFEALSKFDYSLIGRGAAAGLTLMSGGLRNLIELLKSGKNAVLDFLSQFEIMSPIDILKAIANGILSLGKGVVGFFKDLGLEDAIKWLTERFGVFGEVLGRLASAVVDFTNKLTPAKILVFGFGAAIVTMLFTISSAITKFAGVAESLSGVFNSTSGLINALTDRVKPNKFKETAVAILLLAGALAILSQVNPDNLWSAVGALTAIMGAFTLMIGLLAGIEKLILKTPEMIKGLREIGTAMLLMAGSFAVLSGALLLLSKIDMTDMGNRILVLLGIMTALIVGVKILGGNAKRSIADALFVLSFAAAMKLMINTLAALSERNIKFSIDSVGSMIVVIGLLSVLARSMRGIKFTTGLGALALVGSLLVFAHALKQIAKINTATLITALINFLPIFTILGIMCYAVVDTKGLVEMGVGLLAISASLIVLYKAIEMLGQMDEGVLKKGAITVGALMLVIGLMQRIANTSEHGAVKMQGSFLAMGAAILLLGIAIDYIGGLELKKVVQGGIVVAALLWFLTGLAEALGPAQKSTGAIVAMTFAIGLLVAATALLTLLDPKELLVSVTALGVALLSLGKMFEMLGKSNVKLGQAFKFILTMIPVLVIIGAVFTALNKLNPEATLANAIGIGVVMVALAGSMKLFRVTTGLPANLAKSLAVMFGILAMAVGGLYVLSKIPDTDGLLVKVVALGAILTELGVLSYALSKMNFKKSSLEGVAPVIAAVTVLLAVAGAAVALLNMFEINDGLFEKVAAVSLLMAALAGITALISFIKIDPATATNAALAIDAVGLVLLAGITAIAGLAALIGWAFDDTVIEYIDRAIVVFGKVGELFGALIGGFGAGIGRGFMNGLLDIGEGLSNFIGSLGPFIEGLDGIDESKVAAVASLGQMMLAITAADLLNAIRGAKSDDILNSFADSLVDFGETFAEFADEIADINTEKVTAAGYAISSLAQLMASIPFEGGILDFFIGHQDVEKFGKGMQKFAEGFKTYAETIDNAELSQDTVDKTTYATDALVDLANKVPTSGGILQKWLGEQNLGTFGRQLAQFAEGLVGFFRIISGQDSEVGEVSIDYDLVETCANASKALAEVASSIPASGGDLQTFLGSQNMGTFGRQLEQFAEGLVGFFRIMSGEDPDVGSVTIDEDLVGIATRAGEAFAGLVNQLPNTGGIWQAFVGSVSLSDFGDDIADFGEGLYYFFDYFKDAAITDTDVETAKNAGEAFTGLINNLKPNKGAATFFEEVDLAKYGEQLDDLGAGMWDFFQQIEGIDWSQVKAAVDGIKAIIGLSSDMEGMNANNAIKFKSYLTALADASIDQFAAAFEEGVDDITLAIGDTLMNAFDAVSDNPDKLVLDFSAVIDGIVTSITNDEFRIEAKARDLVELFGTTFNNGSETFKRCGANVLVGLVAGMSGTAEAGLKEKVTAVGRLIIENMNSALNISGDYSLRFESIGRYCIAGFVKGFSDEASTSYQKIRTASEGFATAAEKALGVASPSRRFSEIGMYCMLGLKNGIDEYSSTATKSAVKMGENLIGAVKKFFGIHSPSTLTRDEVGRYIVDGIADGITANMSAEEAATKKAQNIVNAFKTEFDKLDAAMELPNMEYEAWQAMNPNASSSSSNAMQAKMLDLQLKNQAERLNAANAQYQATLKALGQNASQTREAYQTYLQEKITMADLASELSELRSSNAIAFREFDQVYRQALDDLEGLGLSQEDIKHWAMEQTGWFDINDIMNGGGQDIMDSVDSGIQNIMDQYLSATTAGSGQVEVVLTNSVSSAMSTSAGIARQGGATIVQETAAGISENSSLLKDAYNNIFNQADGKSAGANLVDGYIDSIRDGAIGVGDAVVNFIANPSVEELAKGIRAKSPSRATYEIGGYFVQGFANGITDGSELPTAAISMLAERSISELNNEVPKFPQIGSQMMQGLANGIASGASSVINAAIAVAKQALSATQAILGIHSPSREYYQIGEYMDQGLANGILDNSSIVTDAISQVLSKAQDTINANQLYITPVVNDDGGESPKFRKGVSTNGWVRDYEKTIYDYGQLLQWDPNGGLIPVGYSFTGSNAENANWWLAPTREIADEIRANYQKLGDIQEEYAAGMRINQGLYQGTVEDLKAAIEALSTAHSGPAVEIKQTINSPKNVNAADVYRATETVTSQLKAKAVSESSGSGRGNANATWKSGAWNNNPMYETKGG